ncbi:MAG TPA: protein translocase subunit SecF [Kiloniellales bacterium]|nr:protein translocase subunit SecF [Kiloniellales bacterium]
MALIRKLPIAPNFAFLKHRMMFLGLSTTIVLGSLLIFAVQGLNLGVDFRGGILMEVRTDGPADLAQMRADLNALGLGGVTLQEFGDPSEVLINIQRQEGGERAQAEAIRLVKEALGNVEFRRTEFVGPKVGSELREAGALATVLALLGIALYVWFRFEWQFALAALAALVHDVIATIGFFSLTQIEFNLSTLAAVLTVAGYSINDTVVIFDRVRETLRKFKRLPLFEVLDKAINGTLSRTFLTSGTTLLALIALATLGGAVIRGFSLGLIWGLLIGTYSSIGLAVPLLSLMNLRGSMIVESESDAAGKAAQSGPERA